MIRVAHLCMRYGSGGGAAARPPALDDVSFEVGRGEIVALLGPNGAGKTTMMRILTGYLAPSDGDAQLAGHSVRTDGLAVRRQVGYLPEGVPLYPDMRVGEYLGHRARLRGLRRSQRARLIDWAVEQCGLGDRRRQIIGTLSRGYRQRVGLCDAIMARPPILILDEPTVGLDPNQIREARELIRALGREQTVLISTHILPEVEALAARVIILHRGRVAAAYGAAELGRGGRARARLLVEVRPEQRAQAHALLGAVAGVSAVEALADGRLALTVDAAGGAPDVRDQIFGAAVAGGLILRELRWEASSLEEIFTRITTVDPPAPDPPGPSAGAGEAAPAATTTSDA
jgi:ABC-2 type transport system ATP-binding protein